MATVTGRKIAVVDGGLVAVDNATTTGTTSVDWVQQQSTYTQTYSTAAKTVPAATFVAPVTTSATNSSPYGYATAAQADAIVTGAIANAADILALKKVVNSLIDDLQALGLVA